MPTGAAGHNLNVFQPVEQVIGQFQLEIGAASLAAVQAVSM
jgi:hypothetical protein